MSKSISSFRQDELKAIYRFIDKADDEEIANILNEINVCQGIQVLDLHTNKLKDVRIIQHGYKKIRLITHEESEETQDD